MDLQTAFDRGFETVKSYIDGELAVLKSREPIPGPPGDRGEKGEAGPQGERGDTVFQGDTVLPPDLAAEVARAVRTLHEAPPPVERAVSRVVRIERDDAGNLTPVYE